MAVTTAQEFLKSAYDQLGYHEGSLYEGSNEPNLYSEKDWIEKGEWLSLTKEVGAERIFFVENNPVVVFAKTDIDEPNAVRELYNKIWCMSRPRLLFLATPGELAVYDLAIKPARDQEDWEKIKPLEIAKSSNEVASKLKTFRREQIETGRLFVEEYRFGDIENRADKALINDLKEVRGELINAGLKGDKIRYAHALIGRSIFIRYLEDREILIREDFQELASKNKKWGDVLENEAPRSGINLSKDESLYARVLSDKDFTFALFEKLANDFNGDMFPDIEEEKKVVTQKHLHLVQDLLFGDVGKQKNLFFYAYKFEIIPIELISSIYEEFYHPETSKEKKRKSSEGAYYTPPALVEFLVNQVLTPERLKTKPRILDPACGSGIFLVEAFRRIVRHKSLELGRNLNFQNLQVILREQIAGIEINPEAVRIAAFSLYLSMLHYLDPPSIREQIYKRGNCLPNLVFNEDDQKEKSYNTLLAKNAFDSDYIENNPVLAQSFSSNCTDIVIGNPPWGSPGNREEDKEAREANKVAINWCKRNKLPVGDQERSQAFIWRTLDLLKSNGLAGLLVSTGVFFKHQKNSVKFRSQWLSKSTLTEIFNFVHTRKIFFSGSISPFAAIVFCKDKLKNSIVSYWTSKKISMVEKLISVIFYKNDLKVLPYEVDELKNYQTWKIFWWGSHKDAQLIHYIQNNPTLIQFSKPNLIGQGYKEANKKNDSQWLKNYQALPPKYFERYNKIRNSYFVEPPPKVESRGVEEIYNGLRLLVRRGILERSTPKGQIIARLEKKKFCFTNFIHGVKLEKCNIWQCKIILGILWSSLARYYFFLTTSNWGIWHHEIQLEDELMQLPVRFPTSVSLKNRIVNIVDKLRSSTLDEMPDMFQSENDQNILSRKEIAKLERQLDDAVFELYELNDAEIDLVRDMCDIILPYYYSPKTSEAGKPVLKNRLSHPYGTVGNLPKETDIAEYIKVFTQSWEAYLGIDTEFQWQIYQPDTTDSMIAVQFSIKKKGRKIERPEKQKSWKDLLQALEKNLTQPFYSSQIYIEGMVRAVTEDYIIIIKCNEKRLWTRSMAREDAEATLVQAMNEDNMRERII